ncbi:stage III sporulation protein AF [Paenibacillus agricola]|uniref:Stage III sporulation protein AF n=1 Tax=Paenibacillus agricola TaxID=2716264 RepID=A0ABX0J3Z9_9BACL|nr:stage III sporulation protein AF [Paenibacillus agricola]NHN28841.1 stage III sporulation protein AF [Paenibacillus agricola]
MDWLSDWLKSVVMVILLASFVDILLPSQTMQRYVKTVISLFILLTLLQPVLSLLQKQTSIDQLLADADVLLQGKSAPAAAIPAFSPSSTLQMAGGGQKLAQAPNAGMQTLESIQQQAVQLQTAQEKRSQQLMQQQITTLMKQNVEQALPFKVQSLNVETGKDAQGQMQIIAIHLQVSQRNEAVSSKQAEPKLKALQVEPVKPVSIAIRADGAANKGGSTDGSSATSADSIATSPSTSGSSSNSNVTSSPSSSFAQEKSQIQSLISKEWQVPNELIFVEVSKI